MSIWWCPTCEKLRGPQMDGQACPVCGSAMQWSTGSVTGTSSQGYFSSFAPVTDCAEALAKERAAHRDTDAQLQAERTAHAVDNAAALATMQAADLRMRQLEAVIEGRE